VRNRKNKEYSHGHLNKVRADHTSVTVCMTTLCECHTCTASSSEFTWNDIIVLHRSVAEPILRTLSVPCRRIAIFAVVPYLSVLVLWRHHLYLSIAGILSCCCTLASLLAASASASASATASLVIAVSTLMAVDCTVGLAWLHVLTEKVWRWVHFLKVIFGMDTR